MFGESSTTGQERTAASNNQNTGVTGRVYTKNKKNKVGRQRKKKKNQKKSAKKGGEKVVEKQEEMKPTPIRRNNVENTSRAENARIPKDKGGGQVHIPMKKKVLRTSFLVSYLTGFVSSLEHQFPCFFIKETGTDVKSYEVICDFEGKTFRSEPANNLDDAMCNAALKGLEYYGFNVTSAKEYHDIHDVLRIKKRCYHLRLGPLVSPFHHTPSLYTRWISHHFESNDVISGEPKTVKDCEHMFNQSKISYYINKGYHCHPNLSTSHADSVSIGDGDEREKEMKEKVMEMLLGKSPAIDGKPLHDYTDITIGEIDGENKNIVTLGNNRCSFKMFCQDGKIRSKYRSCDVELLAGHSIRGLNCSYQLMLPSQQIYLKAESCDDLTYPYPALPVVTSCGMVVLLFDHEASTQEIQILLTRLSSVNPFATKARFLASYFNKVICGQESQSRFNVAECTENIQTWHLKEIKLLSGMTMESLHELMSPYVSYDDRWNKIFMKELPDALKELETVCVAEIQRRTNEGKEKKAKEIKGSWELPTSRFRHSLMPAGVVIESQIMCVCRALRETTGLKVKLADIEETPTVDIPYDGKEKSHRGDVSRYYIWKGLRTATHGVPATYYNYYTATRTALGDEWANERDIKAANKHMKYGGPGKRARIGNDTKEAQPKKKERKEVTKTEEEEPSKQLEEEEPAKQLEEEEPAKQLEEEEPAKQPEEEESMIEDPVEEKKKKRKKKKAAQPSQPNTRREESKAVQDECQWFPLEEAKTLCPMLMKISTAHNFMGQVQKLQCEAETFLKEKESNST